MLKFNKTLVPGLLGQTTVFEEVETNTGEPFQIRADAGGVKFVGQSMRITDLVDLNELAKTVDLAYKAHRQAQPKITSVTGH